jgi:hypothetical protein
MEQAMKHAITGTIGVLTALLLLPLLLFFAFMEGGPPSDRARARDLRREQRRRDSEGPFTREQIAPSRWTLFSILALGLGILALDLPARAQDLYVEFENIAAGTTDAAINMGTISHTNGNAVTFAWTGSAGKVSVENGGMNYGLLRPVTVGGISYTNSAFTKHLLCKSDNTVSLQQMFTWTFAASTRKASFGFFLTISNFTGLGSTYSIGGLYQGNAYSIANVRNDSPLVIQNEGFTSPYGEDITIQNNVPIWVTGFWDSANATANNRSRMYFYNATNWTLIGFSIDSFAVQNDKMTDFEMGIQDAHTKDAGTAYRIGAMLVYTNVAAPVWPGNNLQIPTNSSSTAVTTAIAAAANGDFIVLPATNQTWTSGVTLNKDSVWLSGLAGMPGSILTKGTNSTVIKADGVFDALTVSGDFNTVTNFQITGDGSNDEATGIVNTGAHNRYSWLFIQEMAVGFYAKNSGLLDSSLILNCEHSTRNIFGDAYYNTWNPLPLDSTNAFVYEDDTWKWTSGKNTTGPSPFMSSQQGQAFMVRHSYFEIAQAGTTAEPAIDYHGDWDPGSDAVYRPGAMLQIYSNVFNFPNDAPSAHGAKFVDVRGGPFTMIYSNQILGGNYAANDGIVYREEHMFDDSTPYTLTNAFNFNNSQPNGNMPVNNPLENGGQVFAGREYTNVAPAVLVQLAYPHPMRGIAAPPPPSTMIPVFVGPGRNNGSPFISRP